MPIEPIVDKWRAFGWNVLEIDGHDMTAVVEALEEAKAFKDKPSIIVARTIKGKGVSYMENMCEWHGKAPNKEQAESALDEIRRCSSES
jgi:transketolase